MKFDPPLGSGTLLRRYKRFLADVRLDDGSVVTMHCPNTGAMLGCADPGSRVWYSTRDGTARKYRHTLEIVTTAAGDLVGVHSARANTLVAEALGAQRIAGLACRRLQREVTLPDRGGRIDFRIEVGDAGALCFLEVKSVTLAFPDRTGAFPDAPSERARRHVEALAEIRAHGQRAVLLFCVQHTGIDRVRAAREIDPGYATALGAARRAGVEVMAYGTRISPEAIELAAPLPVDC